QPTVPAQDRVRVDEETRPAPARKRAAQCREDRTVGGSQLGSLHLAAEHLELVAEHGDLDVFGVLASWASEQHAGEPARHDVEERQGHRRIIAWPGPGCSAYPGRVSEPYGRRPDPRRLSRERPHISLERQGS